MPATVTHQLSATTPDDPLYEIRPSHWNSDHALTLNLTGSEISGAFSNANGFSFGVSNGAITGSYTVPVAGAAITVSDVAGSGTIGRLAFTNLNGVTLSLSTGAAGSHTIVGSHNALTSQSNQNALASNGNFNFQTLSFSNANGMSFGTSAGSAIVGSYTVPTVTNSSMTVSDAATSGTLARLAFTNLNGVTLSLSTGANGSHTIVGSHNALTSQSNQAFSAGGGSSAFQTLGFSDNAQASFTNTNGSVAVADVRASFFATGNTTQSSSGSMNVDTVILRGSGAASVGVSNGSVIIDVAAGAAAVTQSVGMSTQTAGGATAGTTGYATGDDILYHFVPGSNITMSQSVDGASATLSIYGASGGGGAAPTLSYWCNVMVGSSGAQEFPDAILHLRPLAPNVFPGNMSVSTMFFNISGTVSTAAPFTRSMSVGFYTMQASDELRLAFSASTSWGTDAGNMNANDSFAGARWVTLQSSQFNNAPNFSQTQYWMGVWMRSSSGSQSFSYFGNSLGIRSQPMSGFMSSASATNTTHAWLPFLGNYSASISTAMPGTISASDVHKQTVNTLVPYVFFNNLGTKIV